MPDLICLECGAIARLHCFAALTSCSWRVCERCQIVWDTRDPERAFQQQEPKGARP